MKTGIYGGTFNPIHNGHLNILREFYYRLGLDRIIIIPTFTPPHKKAKDLASPQDRYNMCLLGVKELDFNVEVSKIEMDRQEKSYTADTLVELRKLYPQDSFYLLMGEDMFLTVSNWYAPHIIFENATICAAVRSADGVKRMKVYGEVTKNAFNCFNYIIEDIPFMDISSTEIREGLLKSLPKSVLEYIERGEIYFSAKV